MRGAGGSQGGVHVAGEEGRAAPACRGGVQRQQHRELEAIHMLRRHSADDRGGGGFGQCELHRGGAAAGHQRAPWLGVDDGCAGAAGGEHQRCELACRNERDLCAQGGRAHGGLLAGRAHGAGRHGQASRLVRSRIGAWEALRQRREPGCRPIPGHQADLAPKQRGCEGDCEGVAVAAQVDHVPGVRQRLRQHGRVVQERGGGHWLPMPIEQGGAQRPVDQRLQPVRLWRHAHRVRCASICAARLRSEAKICWLRPSSDRSYEAVGPCDGQRQLQRVDRVQPQALPEQPQAGVDGVGWDLKLQSVHDQLGYGALRGGLQAGLLR